MVASSSVVGSSVAHHVSAASSVHDLSEKQPKKQDELSKEHQRKLFRSEQTEGGVVALYSAVPFAAPQHVDGGYDDGLDDDESADDGMASQNLQYFGPKGSQQTAMDGLNGSNVVLDEDILHVLRLSGPIEGGRIARKLAERGFEEMRKKIVNPILYQLKNQGRVTIERMENLTPIWKSSDAERTSYDEVLDFAKSVSAGVCVCMVPKEMQDGFRVSCTLIWDDVHGTICSSSVRLHEAEARTYAAHNLLRLLSLQRPRYKEIVTNLWQIAFERGLNFQRGVAYPSSLIEETLREWKGSSNEDNVWPLEIFLVSLKEFAIPNMCGMWNTMALHPDIGDQGEIVFGLHDHGTIHAIAVPWTYTTTGDVESARVRLRVEVQDRITDQWKNIVECTELMSGLFTQYYAVEIVHVRPSRKNGDEHFVHFLVRIVVKKIPGLKVMRCKDLFQKRSVLGHKAELVRLSLEELSKLMQ